MKVIHLRGALWPAPAKAKESENGLYGQWASPPPQDQEAQSNGSTYNLTLIS